MSKKKDKMKQKWTTRIWNMPIAQLHTGVNISNTRKANADDGIKKPQHSYWNKKC